MIYQELDRYDDAEQVLREALAVGGAALGRDHPWVGDVLGHLAEIAGIRGDHVTARALQQRVLAQREHTLGPTHYKTGSALADLSAICYLAGDYEAARLYALRAVEVAESDAREHPDGLGISLVALAHAQTALALPAQALVSARRAVAVHRSTGDEPNVSWALVVTAEALLALGRYREARAEVEEAVSRWERFVGATGAGFVHLLAGLGEVYQRIGEHALAKATLARAERIAGAAAPVTQPN